MMRPGTAALKGTPPTASSYRGRWEEERRSLQRAADELKTELVPDERAVERLRQQIAEFDALPRPETVEEHREPRTQRDVSITPDQLQGKASNRCVICETRPGEELAEDGRLVCRHRDCQRKLRERARARRYRPLARAR